MSALHPDVREFLIKDFARVDQPSAASCFRRALDFALRQRLPAPSDGAMRRALREEATRVAPLPAVGGAA